MSTKKLTLTAYALVPKKEDWIDEYWPNPAGPSYLSITKDKKQAERFIKNNKNYKFIEVVITEV
jgi:hypothetical protein